jgi:hypothetical protein
MIMKNILKLLIVILISISLSGCDDTPEDIIDTVIVPPTPTPTPDEGEETPDEGEETPDDSVINEIGRAHV